MTASHVTFLARSTRVAVLGIALGAALSMGTAETARAQRPVITVGEVSARVRGADARTEQSLRALVTRELERLRLERQGRDQTYVFSAALVRLDARTSGDGARATCVVSGMLRRAGTGAIVAVMQGSGEAEDDRSALEGAKERALEAAVHGAVRHVPDAV